MSASTVLFLSDNPSSIETWMHIFRQSGLDTVLAPTPTAARHHWKEAAPLLTVIDLPIDGSLAICRELRATGYAPILVILPSSNGNDIFEAWRAGATECLIQPANPAVILLKALAWSMRAGREWRMEAPASSPILSEMVQ